MWQLENTIDALRIPGDIALAASFPILWRRLYLFGPRGISIETQILHLITFVTRYTHPGSFSLGFYNSFMKGWLLAANFFSVSLLFFWLRPKVLATMLSRPLSSPIILIILPAFILSLLIHYPARDPPPTPISLVPQTTMINIAWAFSQYLSVGAMIPQLGLMIRFPVNTTNTSFIMKSSTSTHIRESDVEDAAAVKSQRGSFDEENYYSSDEEDDEESKALLLPFFPPTIPVSDPEDPHLYDDDIESQESPACSFLPSSTEFHEPLYFSKFRLPLPPSFQPPKHPSWTTSTWLDVDFLLWAYLASVSLFRVFYVHHWIWRYRVRGTHDPISLASACTQLVACAAGIFAAWLNCASTRGYKWRMRGLGEAEDDENENERRRYSMGVGTSLGVPSIEITPADSDEEDHQFGDPPPLPPPPKASTSRNGRRKLKKGKGRRRRGGGSGGGGGGGLELRTLDTIVETPELEEAESVEENSHEILSPEPDAWDLENDVLLPRSPRSPSPSQRSNSDFRPLSPTEDEFRPDLLHPLWTRTTI